MINKTVLDQIRNGVCAVGYSTKKLEEYMKDQPRRPYFKVQGTGFLVRRNMVVTNRHVIEKIQRDQTDFGFPDDQIRLLFVWPAGPNNWYTKYCRFLRFTTFQGRDIAVVEFGPNTNIGPCQPLQLGDPSSLAVTEHLAVCGYPYGTSMLAPDGTSLSRFGPVVQRGYLSAVSPYDVCSQIDELLLDVRTAGGMSGSPVFRPDDGSVIGIIRAGWEATTSVAIPIDDQRVQGWIAAHEKNLARTSQTTGEGMTDQGTPESPAIQAVTRGMSNETASSNNGGGE